MRAVAAFCVFLALAALVLSVSAQPPPHRESLVIMYNDSACTHHLRTERIALPSSTKCEPEEFRTHNMSTVFECSTDMTTNVTTLVQNVYNATLMCDNTAVVQLSSTGAAHSCATIQVTYEGMKATVYGHIECAPQHNQTTAVESAFAIKGAAFSVPAPVAQPKSFLATIFGL